MRTWLILLVVTVLVAATVAKKDKKNKKDACRYEKGGNKWTACTDGKMSITKSLKEGSGSHCSDTKKIERPCGKSKCKYSKSDWSECDEAGMQTRTMKLLKGTNCEATKTKSRACKKGCKYEKGSWGACDPTTNKMSRTLTLVEGGSHCEQVKTREKTCRKPKKGGRKGKRSRKERKKRAKKSKLPKSDESKSTKMRERKKNSHQSESSLKNPVTENSTPKLPNIKTSENTKRMIPVNSTGLSGLPGIVTMTTPLSRTKGHKNRNKMSGRNRQRNVKSTSTSGLKLETVSPTASTTASNSASFFATLQRKWNDFFSY